jgi:hypothetical protein
MAKVLGRTSSRSVVSVSIGAPHVYAAYVLDGLTAVFGERIRFRQGLSLDPSSFAVAFKVESLEEARFYVSLGDRANLDPVGMEWATVYGKVNPLARDCRTHPKLLPVGPTFGVRLRSPSLAARSASVTYGRTWSLRRLPYDLYSILRYKRWRLPITRYTPGESDPGYVFYAAWPWKKHAEVNPPRARFIEVCRSSRGLDFEGGFAPRRREDVKEVLPLSAPRRYGMAEYLSKSKRSVAVFNNPAVHDCHGWKLGEYLALGKAIISLPLTRALPAPLEHGVHIHSVDGSRESIAEALEVIRRDPSYRGKLEVNARRWYLDCLEPAALIRRLLANGEAMAGR